MFAEVVGDEAFAVPVEGEVGDHEDDQQRGYGEGYDQTEVRFVGGKLFDVHACWMRGSGLASAVRLRDYVAGVLRAGSVWRMM